MGEVLEKVSQEIVAEVRDLKVYHQSGGGIFSKKRLVRAVDGVSFKVHRGEIVGLVGESGCGKSTLARGLLRLIEPYAGSFDLLGMDFLSLRGRELRRARRHIQMVFQDPYTSLNPRLKVGYAVEEPLIVHRAGSRSERKKKVEEIFTLVGLHPDDMKKYPHEFSGGQRQRIAIARAIILNPDMLIADEPTSALDVSVQAQIVNLFLDLKDRFNMSYVFISHDLRLVEFISHRILVMYLGKIVEVGPSSEVMEKPLHPYTKALVSAIPSIDKDSGRKKIVLSGDVPSPENPPGGCRFHPRCPEAFNPCPVDEPELVEISSGRKVACHLYNR